MARKSNVPTNITDALVVAKKVALGQSVPMSHLKAAMSLIKTCYDTRGRALRMKDREITSLNNLIGILSQGLI